MPVRAGWAVLMLALYAACGWDDPCGNKVLASVPSPDGSVRAVVFQRDCGATTGFSTQVYILPRNARFLERPAFFRSTQAGNVFVADKGGVGPAKWKGGGPWVQVTWSTEPRSLVVRHDVHARVFLREAKALGNSVTYEAVGPE